MESHSASEPSLIRFSHVQLNYAAISWPGDTQCPNTDTTKGTETERAKGSLYPVKVSFHSRQAVCANIKEKKKEILQKARGKAVWIY